MNTDIEFRKERKKLAQRKRRIIFNNDGDDLVRLGPGVSTLVLGVEQGLGRKTVDSYPISAKGLLEVRTTPLLESQVDTIAYYSTWGMKLHHSDGPFGQLYQCRDTYGGDEISISNYRKILADTGMDCLDVMIDAGRKHGIEVFHSNRMNDWHSSFDPTLMYNISVEHPEWLLSTQEQGGKYQYPDVRSCWATWDFEVPEIRQLTVDALREVCENYDIDGIELDFLRGTMYFKPTIQHATVEQKHIDLMNDMMRKIRTVTEEEGMKRGRPILVMARCTNDVALSRSIGLDVETWLKEDLIDILQAGRWTEFRTPIKELVDLGHQYGVPVYPGGNTPRASAVGQHGDRPKPIVERGSSQDQAIWRGSAMNFFAEGADGVYTYNVFDPTLWLWWELGAPKSLAGKDTTYVWDYLPSRRAESDVLPVLRLTRRLGPVTVTPEGCEPMPLLVGEDLSTVPPAGKKRTLKLRVHVVNLMAEHEFTVAVNGETLQASNESPAQTDDPQDVWLEFVPDPTIFRMGENLVAASANASDTLKDRIAKLKAATTVTPFPPEWRFTTDPTDTGVSKKWYDIDFDDSKWTMFRSDIGEGWERQMGLGDQYGWYRTEAPALPKDNKCKYAYIHFGAVDEQAWVYLNGELVAEHTVESTGASVHDLWAIPFIVDITSSVRRNGPNVLSVRVHNSAHRGGIWRPVFLIGSDIKDMTPTIAARYMNGSLEVVQISDIELDVQYSDL